VRGAAGQLLGNAEDPIADGLEVSVFSKGLQPFRTVINARYRAGVRRGTGLQDLSGHDFTKGVDGFGSFATDIANSFAVSVIDTDGEYAQAFAHGAEFQADEGMFVKREWFDFHDSTSCVGISVTGGRGELLFRQESVLCRLYYEIPFPFQELTLASQLLKFLYRCLQAQPVRNLIRRGCVAANPSFQLFSFDTEFRGNAVRVMAVFDDPFDCPDFEGPVA
jgi:hypothetical protein